MCEGANLTGNTPDQAAGPRHRLLAAGCGNPPDTLRLREQTGAIAPTNGGLGNDTLFIYKSARDGRH
jgi:hypothetical protein